MQNSTNNSEKQHNARKLNSIRFNMADEIMFPRKCCRRNIQI